MGKQHSETVSQSISDLSSRFRLGTTGNYVATQLRNMIVECQYVHNERLPSERHLAEQFQVSRGTIRAVLQVLEDQQMVTRQIGSGTYVNLQITSDQYEISSIISPIEMVEVRIAVEPQMVRLAIANASYRDLENLHNALTKCENYGGNPENFVLADTAFHLALAGCSKNKLLLWVYERISKVRQNAQWQNMKAKLLTPERINYYNEQHRAIYDAILSRDVKKANKLIKNHLYGFKIIYSKPDRNPKNQAA
jgi:DNA-binding FadR family transcriptional regulator